MSSPVDISYDQVKCVAIADIIIPAGRRAGDACLH
jgi:hypothetical protein